MPVKRQGRKTPNRGETPRRRGRRHVQASPAADGSSARSTISTPQTEVKVGDSSGSKITSVGNKSDVVVQEQPHFNPSLAHSSAGTSQEKRKEISGVGGTGRKQTTDVTDVARVMKEIFSETSLLKHKVGEPSETTVTNEPDGKSSETMNMHIAKTSKAENIIQPADHNLRVEATSSSVTAEKQKSESPVMVDKIIKTSSDVKASVTHSDDITPQDTMLVDSKRPVGSELVETEQKVATSTDPKVQIAVPVPNVSEEKKISDSSMLVHETVNPSSGSKSPVDQSDDTPAQGTVPVDSKSPVDEVLPEINKESQSPEAQNDGNVQSLPTPNTDSAEAPNKQAGPSISPSVSPQAMKMTENFGLISKDSSETVPVSSVCVVEDSKMPSASNEHGSPKKPESPEIHKPSGADLDCRITPTNSSEVAGGSNFSGTSTEVPENLNDSVTKSCLEMSVSISEKVVENELLTPNSDDLKCVPDPEEAKDAVGVRSQLGDTAAKTNLQLNPTNSDDAVSSEKAEIISGGHTSNCPPNTSTEEALADQIVTEETSCGVNNPGSSHFPMNEKNLISDVAHPGSGGPIELVTNRDSGTELSVVADAGNDLVKISGVEADSSVVQLSSGDILPDSIASLTTTEPLPTEQQGTNLSTEVKGEEIDGDKKGTTPLIPVEQMNVQPTVGSHELERSYEESQRSPMRFDESSHVDSKSLDTTNQTSEEVEAKCKEGESPDDQICDVGPSSAAIQLSMSHTDGLKTQTSNKNSISLVHEDYGSPLSDSANAEQDSEESASILGGDSCKLGGEASTADTEMVDASVQLPFSAEQVGGMHVH